MNEELEKSQGKEEVVTVDNEQQKEDDLEVESSKNLSFTQEQVNDIVRSRLQKSQARIFNRYGVKDRKELDEMIGKAQSYQVMLERYNLIKDENSSIKNELAFLKNNINPDKQEDVIAYFKGKSIDFNNDNLVKELATHPEWLNPTKVDDVPKTTIKTLGNGFELDNSKPSEKEEMAKYFGLKNFI